MEKYIAYQMELFDNLKNSEKNLKKTPKERIKKQYLETRLEQLETLWIEFKEGHKNIVLKISKDEDRKNPYFKNEVFEAFEEMFINNKSMLKEMLLPFLESSKSQTTGVSDITDSNKNSEIKLPIIKIPTFTGCKRCGRRHHSLIHIDHEPKNDKPVETASTSSGIENMSRGKPNILSNENNIITNFCEHIESNNTLLATVQVLVENKNGCNHVVRALLDQGSQASFVTEATVQLLKLSRRSVSGWVSGVGEGQTSIKYMVSLWVKSRHNPESRVCVNAYVLRSLTTLLPTTKLHTPEWSDIEKLELADPGYTTPGRIDILLGAEVYSDVLLNGIMKHPTINLLARNTIFGWVLSGRICNQHSSARNTVS
ncbi:unnamed protein product, partial [Brenthis ino]